VGGCAFPIVHIHAGADVWTDLADVEHVFQASPVGLLRDMYLLPDTSHKLEHNPAAARVALRQAIVVLKRHLAGEHVLPHDVQCPTFLDIVSKHRRERDFDRVGERPAELTVSHSTV
jgi:hypothetical protein